MNRQPTSFASAACFTGLLAGLLLACGGGSYSPSCKRGVPVTSPWAELGLPLSEGRVCSSNASRIEVQFTKGNRDAWVNAFEGRLVAGGYAKKSCASNYCSYERGTERVQLIGLETAKWQSVVLNKH